MNFDSIRNLEYFNNTVEQYTIALAIFVGLWVIFKIFRSVILWKLEKWARKTKFDIDDEAVAITEHIPGALYTFVALFFAIKPLDLLPAIEKGVEVALIIVVVYTGIKAAQELVAYLLEKSAKKKDRSSTAYHGIKIIINFVLWITGFLLVMDNLGVNITAFVASLGIGGIAVALAVQNILADMFSSFSIYFDKPFEVGDYIVVEPHRGTVLKIGLKTTRIQSLDGEEIVISNKELTETRVQNFKKLKRRRVSFNIGITYETPMAKVKKVNGIVESIFKKVKNTELDRVHFHEFGDFSLNYTIVYHVDSNEYAVYMDAQQEINLALFEAFAKEGIEFAYPTQVQYNKS